VPAQQSPRAVPTQRTRDQRPAAVPATTGVRDHVSLTAERAPAPSADGPESQPGPRRAPAEQGAAARIRSLAESARSPRPESLERACAFASPPCELTTACPATSGLTRPGAYHHPPLSGGLGTPVTVSTQPWAGRRPLSDERPQLPSARRLSSPLPDRRGLEPVPAATSPAESDRPSPASDEADQTYQGALTAGAVLLVAPVDAPYGDRWAMVRDPFDNVCFRWPSDLGRLEPTW
jgi:hypothetical protein